MQWNHRTNPGGLKALIVVAGILLCLATAHGSFAKDGESGSGGSGSSGSSSSGSGSSGSSNSGSGKSDSGKSDSSKSGSEKSGSDTSKSEKSNSKGSGHSGSSSKDDKTGKDASLSGDDAIDKGKVEANKTREREFSGGWRVQIRQGRYRVFDPAGRLVINRKARDSDYRKF